MKGQLIQRGFRITGRVQGVFFRAWTRETGADMGLGGTVRNLPDGSVEAHVVGLAERVEALEKRFWEGPSASKVDGVESFPSQAKLDPNAFEILY